MTSRPFLRKNHNFKRGLIDKWCISNASLDNALLVSKFIEIIMLIKMSGNFLVSADKFPVFKAEFLILTSLIKCSKTLDRQKLIRLFSKQPPSWQRRSDGPGANVNLRKLWLTLALNVALRALIVSRPTFLTSPLN
ncbi:hypothetical protein ACP0HM_12725 [Escherichia coli]